MNIVIINGPNLNLLGKRKPEIYGTTSFDDFLPSLYAEFAGHDIIALQSNHEGQIIDWLHQYGFGRETGIVLNAAGYTHTSVSIRDAVEAVNVPVVEVHISDITRREPFRHTSLLTDVCRHSIIGHGLDGYREAVRWLVDDCYEQ